jgi:hypothetical protein
MTTSNSANFVKARLRNLGDGVLELTNDAIKFYIETGRFRKQRKIAREISYTDVETAERQGNDLIVTWKSTIETFTIKQSKDVDAIYEKITANLTKHEDETQNQAAAMEKKVELAKITLSAMDTIDSLFSILKSLHGRVDWKLVETNYKKAEENAAKLLNQGASQLNLEVNSISVAVQEHHAKEAAEKTLAVLKALYDGFDGLASSVDSSEELHPTPHDGKLAIQALYVVNDMLLGTVVGDQEIAKEGSELLNVLDDLAKVPSSKIDTFAVKASLDNFYVDKETQETFVQDLRSKLDQQFKESILSEAGTEKPREAQT